MAIGKETEVTIPTDRKETIQDRLKTLFRGRNMRRVAADWGLPYSTLNNYFSKGAKPGLDVVETVCNVENISLEWLITGNTGPGQIVTQTVHTTEDKDPLKVVWGMIFDSIERSDAEALIRLIYAIGAKGIIASASSANEINQAILALSDEEKERLWALHEAKKGTSEERDVNEAGSLTDKRQAG